MAEETAPAAATAGPGVADKFELLNRSLRPVHEPPRLRTINGVGSGIVGRLEDKDLAPKFFGLYAPTTFGIPLGAERIFLLSHPILADGKIDPNAFLFHGEISKEDFAKVYPEGLNTMKSNAWALGMIAIAIGVVLFLVVSALRGRW